MAQTIRKTKIGDSPEGEIFKFRIPDSTEDYIEVTNFGAGIISLNGMNLECKSENVLAPLPEGKIAHPILTGKLPEELNVKPWAVVEEGSNYVIFESSTSCGTVVDIKFSYINRNRFVCDFKAVPSYDRPMNLIANVPLAKKNFEVSEFDVPSMVGGLKAVYELVDSESAAHISFYSDVKPEISTDEACTVLTSTASREVKEGEANTQTIMISADFIRPIKDLECVFTKVDTFDKECIFETVDQFDKECIFETVDQFDKECIFETVDQFDKECIFETVDQFDKECIFETVDQFDKECIFETVDQFDKECIFETVDQFDKECIFETVDQFDKECIFETVDQFDKECIFETVDQQNSECIFEDVDQNKAETEAKVEA